MRVLGIDPGLTRCGLGVVEGTVGRPLTLIDVNVVRTSADLPIAQRLVTIEKGIDAWLDEYKRRGRAGKEVEWPVRPGSTGVVTLADGGLQQHYRTAAAYASLLGLKTETKR